jgi:hypothetical protein
VTLRVDEVACSRVSTDKDRLREEVEHFVEEYDGLDEDALDQLLIALMVRSYPTKEGQDS